MRNVDLKNVKHICKRLGGIEMKCSIRSIYLSLLSDSSALGFFKSH